MKHKESDLFKFRRYKKKQGKKGVSHPKLIVDKHQNQLGFMGLTSSKSKGKRHKNIQLKTNPQKGNLSKAYLRRKIEYDKEKMFDEVLKDYQLDQDDIEFIKAFVDKHKKR